MSPSLPRLMRADAVLQCGVFLLVALAVWGPTPTFAFTPLPIARVASLTLTSNFPADIVVDNITTRFFMLQNHTVFRINMLDPTLPIEERVDLPGVLAYGASPGRLRYDTINDVLWVCSGAGVGIIDPNNLAASAAIVWTAPLDHWVTSCSLSIPGVVWVAARFDGLIKSTRAFVLHPSSRANIREPWLHQVSPLEADYVARPLIEILPDGSAYLMTRPSLYTFMAVPEPITLPSTPSQAVPATFAMLYQDNNTVLVQSPVRAYTPYNGGANIGFPEESLGFGSLALDGSKNLLWRAVCEQSGFVLAERYSLVPSTTGPNPTHSLLLNVPGNSAPCTSSAVETAAAGVGIVHTKANRVILAPTGTAIVVLEMHNCSYSSTCGQCSIEKDFCSWCASPDGSKCVDHGHCLAPSVPVSTCPVISSATPPSISVEGSNSVVVSGNNFQQLELETSSLGGLYCSVGDSLAKASVFSDALIRCPIDPITYDPNTMLHITLNNSVPLDPGSAFNLTTYSCASALSCADCASLSKRDCVWCASDSICVSRLAPDSGQCPTEGSIQIGYANSAATCATLLTITPTSIPSHFKDTPGIPQTINITSSFPNAAAGWSCSFGGFAPDVAGTLDFESNTLKCDIPVIASVTTDIMVPVRVKLHGTLFAANSLNLVYYDCPSATGCSSCYNRDYCGWCLSSATCMASTATCTDFLPPSSPGCPNGTMSPLSTLGTAATTLTITGGPFTSGASYTCRFTGTAAGTSPATFVSTTSVTCDAPAYSVTTSFDSTVDVLVGTNVYLRAGTLRYYTCAGVTTSCSACAHPLHTECAWCVEESRCDTVTNMGTTCTNSQANAGMCPSVTSISPNIGTWMGGEQVTLTGTGFAYSGTYECTFYGPANQTEPSRVTLHSAATSNSATSLTCTTPAATANTLGSYSVGVTFSDTLNASTPLASIATFQFVDCRGFDSCGTCLQAPASCAWCLGEARCKPASGTCLPGLRLNDPNSCPAISSVNPTAAQAKSNITVSIKGTHLNNPLLNSALRCIVDGVNLLPVKATAGTPEDTLTFSTHTTSSPGTHPFRLLTTILRSATYARAFDEFGVPLQFTTFDCASAKTCDQCATSVWKQCGWCSSDNKCSDAAACSNPSSWAQKSCPHVTKLSRTMVDESTIGKSLVLSVSNLRLSAGMDLMCSFSTPAASTYTTPTSISIPDGTVTCPIGASPNSNQTAFSIAASVGVVSAAQLSAPFTSNIADAFYDPASTLEYVRCNTVEYSQCGTCIRGAASDDSVDPRCGWCVYDGTCGVRSSCSLGHPLSQYQNVTTDCATVTGIAPMEGPSTGSTQITISGTGFVQSDRIFCAFGDLLQAASFESTTKLTCNSPAQNSIKSGSVAMDFAIVMRKNIVSPPTGARRALDSSQYSVFASPSQPIFFTYNFVAPPKKQNLAWIAAPVIVAVLLILVAIIVLLVLRRRYRARKLTPPDYPKYAFSANTKLLRDVPEDKKPMLDQLVPLLSENNYLLGTTIAKFTTGSDDDLLCRSLIYSSYPNHFSLDMLLRFIEHEVTNSKMEGELFRASSQACKMYTVYSKIVGVQYLWKTLARSIHTLNDAGQAEDRRQVDGGSNSTPPSTGHVSMMDLGTLEVDPERLAERLEKDVIDEAVVSDVTIYQYELLLKTGRIFKKVLDSIDNVPRELRVVAKRVKSLVSQKYPEREMDYKGVCAFFFLRFICPSVMTPHIYGVLEKAPGETAQRYFVLISKTLQNLANGTLPSTKEAYMARMDEFVLDNKEALHQFIDALCNVSDGTSATDHANHNSKDVRLEVSSELYYSSLSFLHSHYLGRASQIQEYLKANHEEEFANRVEALFKSIKPESAAPKSTKKAPKKKKKDTSPS